ncbi:MAG: multifunctional CCA addition/repair protein [Thiotrichales bacterium]|jgi:tRNA nucleotidyltransferase (CCA-adding enzyme)|nr:multifunctional CCA addition/repair protein [Thiotrichales bacterium]
MNICLVGGAVRDQLLGLASKDRDWVVTGATPEEMLALGYQQVGRDFPVFLHPQTHEEYALARTERKQGEGYYGFVCFSDPSVTLEADLIRRDLTINAMAICQDQLVDPYGGQRDLADKQLRHVSDAFREDPLRVLRVARFAAQLGHLGFVVAPETLALMQAMSSTGELTQLTAERVWAETVKALQSKTPARYFEVLYQVGALAVWMPEVAALFAVPQDKVHHPEGDVGTHTMMVLMQMRLQTDDVACLWAALCHDLGKALTAAEVLPHHPGHEIAGVPLVKALSARLKVPAQVQAFAMLVCRWHGDIHRATRLTPEARLAVLDGCDLWRKPEQFAALLQVSEADARGRLGFELADYPQSRLWQTWAKAVMSITASDFIAQGLSGFAIKEAMRQARLRCLDEVVNA